MPTSCCVRSCKSRRKKGDSSIYFHKFPNEESMKENWLVAIKRTELTLEETKNKVVCSTHFPKSMYLDRPGTYKPRLKPDAIPSIFSFPESNKATPVRRGRRRKREPLAVALKRWGQKRNLEDPSYLPTKAIKREKISPPREDEDLVDVPLPPPRRSGRPRKILIKRDPGESPPREVPKCKAVVESHRRLSRPSRVEKKCKNITELLENLKKSSLITNETFSLLLKHFSDIPLTSFLNANNGLHNSLDNKVKEFALSLYYKSPRAYRFVKKRLKLPHLNTVKNWSFSSNYKAGLLSEVFVGLQSTLQDRPWMSDCVLHVGSLSLNQESVWDEERGKFCGNVDYGACIIEEEELLASEALTIFLMGLHDNWKCPIAYFLVNRISPVVLSQLIKTCLDKLADIGYRAWSITFDEPLRNGVTIKRLGCNLISTIDNKHKILNSFKHPSREYHVHVLFDYHCMLQLARNALCELKTFCYEKEQIKWTYFTKLHNLMEKDPEFDEAPDFDISDWCKHKIKVKLARHLFSAQVADAIDWLRDTAKHKEFQGSQVTADFARTMASICEVPRYNDVHFQVVNNSHQDTKWSLVIHKFISYLVKLQSGHGKMIIHHERRQFVIGLIVTASSLAAISNIPKLNSKVLGTFQCQKLSHDSLKVFFTYIKGNADINPNVSKFKQKLRNFFVFSQHLTFENFYSITKTHCLKLRVALKDNYSFISGLETKKMQEMVLFLHDSLSLCRANVLNYIAGYIAKLILGKLSCSVCSTLLIKHSTSITSLDDQGYSLYKLHTTYSEEMDLGGMIMASDDTVSLIMLAEKQFRFLATIESQLQVLTKGDLRAKIMAAVLLTFVNKRFLPYESHCISSVPVDLSEPLHHLQLIKMVINQYLTFRLQLYHL